MLIPQPEESYYCYICEFPNTPAFAANIGLMWLKIMENGGRSPSVRPSEWDINMKPTAYTVAPQIGTVSNTAKELINFELPSRMTKVELLVYLEEPMSNPIPPIQVHDIRSKYAIINTGTAEVPVWEREVLEQIVRTDIAEFFKIIDPGGDGDPSNTGRSPTTGDVLRFSHYAGGEMIEV